MGRVANATVLLEIRVELSMLVSRWIVSGFAGGLSWALNFNNPV